MSETSTPDLTSPATKGGSGTEWFWRIVDADGLGDVPSDEEAALRLLCRRSAEAFTLRETVAKLKEALKLITLQYMGAGGNLRPEEVQLAMEQIARSALASSETEKRDV